MSKLLADANVEFDLFDRVSFLHEGERLYGKVVRVYNDRLLYHVLVDSQRYVVDISGGNPDEMKKED